MDDAECCGCGKRFDTGTMPRGATVPLCDTLGYMVLAGRRVRAYLCRPFRTATAAPKGDIECSGCGCRMWSGDCGVNGITFCAHCAWGVTRGPEEQARLDALAEDGEVCGCGASRDSRIAVHPHDCARVQNWLDRMEG